MGREHTDMDQKCTKFRNLFLTEDKVLVLRILFST